MSLIDNERVKLRANAFDRASTACLAVGILGPLVTLAAQDSFTNVKFGLLAGAPAWVIACLLLHYVAYKVLGNLK